MKTFKTLYMGGKIKYTTSYHDGVKTHKDGSPFFDLAIFKSKRKQISFNSELVKQGYKCTNP